jgi:hypothetical protein
VMVGIVFLLLFLIIPKLFAAFLWHVGYLYSMIKLWQRVVLQILSIGYLILAIFFDVYCSVLQLF